VLPPLDFVPWAAAHLGPSYWAVQAEELGLGHAAAAASCAVVAYVVVAAVVVVVVVAVVVVAAVAAATQINTIQ